MWQRSLRSVQERVSSLFYSHGLFCASHPFAIISLVITMILITSYPLTTLPLPGNAPLQYHTPLEGYSVPPMSPPATAEEEQHYKRPRWYLGPPAAYVLQVVVKTTVSPWLPKEMIQTDAFRAPISKAFDIMNYINNYQQRQGEKLVSVSDVCLHVYETLKAKNAKGLLPEYGCLVVSPNYFWGNDRSRFDEDSQIVKTLTRSYKQPLDASPSIRDILFGVPWKETGIRHFFIRNRQRVLTFAVSILLKEYNHKYIQGLREHLAKIYPLHLVANSSSSDREEGARLLHVYFKDINYLVEYTPLLVAYTVLFLYLYFSVRKIEMVKSKWGLALSAVVTVVSSLLMSIGICTLFGMTPSLNGSEIFPYLVVIIGLENVLVVTKSVVSTPVNLDVKLRVAKGLSKEGWFIFKNLMAELLILAVGFFTFVPAIQEFCLFAVVGLLSDFFLQMFFFTTVLSIDIRRMDVVMQGVRTEGRGTNQSADIQRCSPAYNSCMQRRYPAIRPPDFRDVQAIRLPPSGVTDEDFILDPIKTTPRRVRFFNYWARTRFMQRAIMACVVTWIILLVYKTGLVEHLAEVALSNISRDTPRQSPFLSRPVPPTSDPYHQDFSSLPPGAAANNLADLGDGDDGLLSGGTPGQRDEQQERLHAMLTHTKPESWRQLFHNHWPTLMAYYNISLRGRYVTILPSIDLSIIVSHKEAISKRHPEEARSISHIQLQGPGSLTGEMNQDAGGVASTAPTSKDAWDKTKTFTPGSQGQKKEHSHGTDAAVDASVSQNSQSEDPKVPTDLGPLHISALLKRIFRQPQSQTELVMTVLLGVASIILLIYCFYLLYHCMCSRNYASWRRRWNQRRKRTSPYYKMIREAMPLELEGHPQEVECVETDGGLIVSSCLGGYVCVWDSVSGEQLTCIQRHREMSLESRSPGAGQPASELDQRGAERETDDASASTQPSHSVKPASNIATGLADMSLAQQQGPSLRTHFSHTRHKSADLSHIRNMAADSPVQQPGSQPHHPQHREQMYDQLQAPQQQKQHNPQHFSTLSEALPDLTPIIDTDFYSLRHNQAQSRPQTLGSTGSIICHGDQLDPLVKEVEKKSHGFDFGVFVDKSYVEHSQMLAEKEIYFATRQQAKRAGSSTNDVDGIQGDDSRSSAELEGGRTRSLSQGDCPDNDSGEGSLFEKEPSEALAPAVWCIACQEQLVVVGCGDGRIEFWDGRTGVLKLVNQDSRVSVTALCFISNRVIAARLNGMVDFWELETFTNQVCTPHARFGVSSHLHHRTAPLRRTSSSSGISADLNCCSDIIHMKLVDRVRAHQRPINVLKSEGGRVVTASQDHTLKVFRVEDSLQLYTLHGHNGGVTALFLDKVSPLAAASGAEDGTVRLWDLMTGGCVHKLAGHVAPVTSLTCTELYVISIGTDDQLCIWERVKGHLLHWIQMEPGYCNSVAMLTSNLMVTGGQGCLHLWDASKGEGLRAVTLGDSDSSIFVRHLRVVGHSTIVCDYGNQLRVIHFPAVLEKAD